MRPRAVVFVGNGFTIELSKELGISDWHDTRTLLPLEGKLAWIQRAAKTDDFTSLPLWHEGRYPELLDHWREFSTGGGLSEASSFSAFCEFLASQMALRSQGDGQTSSGIAATSVSATLQLRRYLWHTLFELTNRFYTNLVSACDDGRPWPFPLLRATGRWPLAMALRELAETWDLTIVSFNYEHYLEQVLLAHGCSCVHLRLSDLRPPSDSPTGSVRVIHPHGELANQAPKPVFGFGDELDFNFPTGRPCPDIPDLVPPGHDDSHILGARTRARDVVRRFVGNADVLGSIGFSAQRPDDREFMDYLEAHRPGATTFWIGRKPEHDRESADKILGNLSKTAGHFSFDVAQAESEFLPWIRKQITVSVGWSSQDDPWDLEGLFTGTLNAINRRDLQKIDGLLPLFDRFQNDGAEHLREGIVQYLRAENARQYGDSPTALTGYEAMINICSHDHRLGGLMMHLYLKCAQSYLSMHDVSLARNALEQAKTYAQETLQPHDEVEFLATDGEVLLIEGRFTEARERLAEALLRYLKLREYANAALCALQCGHAAVGLQDLREAELKYCEAGKMYDSSGDQRGVGMALSSLSLIWLRIAPFQLDQRMRAALEQKSIQAYSEAFQLLFKTNMHEAIIAVVMRAHYLYHQDKRGEAKTLFAQALRLCHAAKLPHLLPVINQAIQVVCGTEQNPA